MAKLDGQVREVEGYVREMGGYVGSTPACYGSSLSSNPYSSQKYKRGDISTGVANMHTLAHLKRYEKGNEI
jgi:hypothetical protein